MVSQPLSPALWMTGFFAHCLVKQARVYYGVHFGRIKKRSQDQKILTTDQREILSFSLALTTITTYSHLV